MLATWPAALVFVPVIAWMAFVVTVTGTGTGTSPLTHRLLNAVAAIPGTMFGTTAIGLLRAAR